MEWIREGNFVYALNRAGTNHFSASVQRGNGTTEAEVEDVAILIAAAPELADALDHLLLRVKQLGVVPVRDWGEAIAAAEMALKKAGY